MKDNIKSIIVVSFLLTLLFALPVFKGFVYLHEQEHKQKAEIMGCEAVIEGSQTHIRCDTSKVDISEAILEQALIEDYTSFYSYYILVMIVTFQLFVLLGTLYMKTFKY